MKRTRLMIVCLALAMYVVPSAHAALGEKSPEEKAAEQAEKTMKQATKLYDKAYQEVAKGRKELEDGKAEKAQERFAKALELSKQAVELKPDYYEAWNVVGYTSRKGGDYDAALAAYEKCLGIEPNYVPAREYLGEAFVELGRLDDAREQLEWLNKLEATEEAEELSELIAAAEAQAKAKAKPKAAADEHAGHSH